MKWDMNAGLRGLQTILSRGKLEHEAVGTLQVVVDYLVLMEVSQARRNLQKCTIKYKWKTIISHVKQCHLLKDDRLFNPIMKFLVGY